MDAILTHSKPYDDTSKTCSLVVFRVADQSFALDVQCVDQLTLMMRLTRPPHLNYMIEGIANVHGKAVPVINARRCFGLPEIESGLYTPIILVNVDDRRLGLTVDEVIDVIEVPEDSIIPPSVIYPDGLENPFVTSLVYRQGKTILALDPHFLFNPSEFPQASVSLPKNDGRGTEKPPANGKVEPKKRTPRNGKSSSSNQNPAVSS